MWWDVGEILEGRGGGAFARLVVRWLGGVMVGWTDGWLGGCAGRW